MNAFYLLQLPCQEIYDEVAPFLKTIEPGISWGGINCLDAHEYDSNLSASRRYECTVTGDIFKPYFFAHRFPPFQGQVLRMAEHFATATGSESDAVIWPSPIDLLARDSKSVPNAGEASPLANDVVWLGFLKYFADQIKTKDAESIKKCRHALRRVRVTFHLCSSDDNANQLKWKLEQNVENIAANQTLKGWKRICGYAAIRDDLKERHLPHNGDSVSDWLSKAKVTISGKNVGALLRVYDRMTAAGASVMRALEAMESEYQSEHYLSNTSVLQMICEKTSVNKNSLLQNALLNWVVQGLVARTLAVNDGKVRVLSATATRASCLALSQSVTSSLYVS